VFILIGLLLIARRHIHIRPTIELRRWFGWLKETIPIVLGAAIGTVYFRLDAVMLSQLDDLRAVGLYGIAYKFSDLLAYLPAAIMAPAFTLLVRAWPEQPAMFWRNFRGTLILLMLAAFTLTAGFCAFAGPLIGLLYGSRYEPAANAARLVVVGQGIRFFTVLCTLTLVAVRRNVMYAIASIVGLFVNVALNLVLIPRYSYGGAAFATVATELGVLAILIAVVRTIPEREPFPWAPTARVGLAAGALVVVALAAQTVMPWPVAGLLSAGVLVAVLQVVGIDGPGGLRVVPHLLVHVDDPGTSDPPLDPLDPAPVISS
jgi:O-antigen/teichoic acid export membrane protein